MSINPRTLLTLLAGIGPGGSPALQEIRAIEDKTSKSRLFFVEGLPQ